MNPLNYQVGEFDCGTTAFVNALSYLLGRNGISPSILKAVYRYTIDGFDDYGVYKGGGGTTKNGMKLLCNWINKHEKIKCAQFENEFVNKELIEKCISNNGVVVARCYQDYEHYVTIVDIDDKYVYIFDSYYLNENAYLFDKDVKVVLDKPNKYNRKVSVKRVFSQTKKDFSLGDNSFRECILINR